MGFRQRFRIRAVPGSFETCSEEDGKDWFGAAGMDCPEAPGKGYAAGTMVDLAVLDGSRITAAVRFPGSFPIGLDWR
jgi:hypothetical protein